MTQQQLTQKFKGYSKAQKSTLLSQLLRIFADELEENSTQNNFNASTVETRKIRAETLEDKKDI